MYALSFYMRTLWPAPRGRKGKTQLDLAQIDFFQAFRGSHVEGGGEVKKGGKQGCHVELFFWLISYTWHSITVLRHEIINEVYANISVLFLYKLAAYAAYGGFVG